MQSILKPLLDYLDAAGWPEVQEMADSTSVPLHTIAKIKRGETQNPRVQTVEKLLGYIHTKQLKALARSKVVA